MDLNSINSSSEDVDLIESFKNGNETAFNYIVMRYQKKVYWVIKRMVLEHDDTNDITQEVFIKLFKSLKEFRGDSSLFTYIYKIAVNYSLNHLKKNKNLILKFKPMDSDESNISSKDKNIDEKMIEEEHKLILLEAINGLPEQQRAVFNLRFYENLSYEEISKILGKSVGGMKANYFHAFKKIESVLKSKKDLLLN